MDVSIIIPVYNVDSYLPACLDSVLAQDFSGSFEIIVVNDGSTDAGARIADEYAALHPQLIRVIHQANAGLGGARNTGIAAAAGDYLLFVDSDDTVAPDMLSTLFGLAAAHGADMAVCGMRVVGEDGRTIETIAEDMPENTALPPASRPDMLLCHPVAWNRLTRRRVFTDNNILFPPRTWYEDLRTTPKLLLGCDSVVFTRKPLYNYLRRSGSITNNRNVRRNREIVDAFDDLILYFRDNGLFDSCRDELEFLCVSHLFLAASVRVLRVDPDSELLAMFREYLFNAFPEWRSNRYLSRMRRLQRLALKLCDARRYRLLALLFKVKDGARL